MTSCWFYGSHLGILENLLRKINKKLIKNIENVSSLHLNRKTCKMYSEQIYAKIVKTVFEKVVAMAMA